MQLLAFRAVLVLMDHNPHRGLGGCCHGDRTSPPFVPGFTSMTNDFLWVNRAPALYLILTGYVSNGKSLVSHILRTLLWSVCVCVCVSVRVYFHTLSKGFVLWDYTPVWCLDVRLPPRTPAANIILTSLRWCRCESLPLSCLTSLSPLPYDPPPLQK